MISMSRDPTLDYGDLEIWKMEIKNKGDCRSRTWLHPVCKGLQQYRRAVNVFRNWSNHTDRCYQQPRPKKTEILKKRNFENRNFTFGAMDCAQQR